MTDTAPSRLLDYIDWVFPKYYHLLPAPRRREAKKDNLMTVSADDPLWQTSANRVAPPPEIFDLNENFHIGYDIFLLSTGSKLPTAELTP